MDCPVNYLIDSPHSLSSCSLFYCDFWVIVHFFIRNSFGLALDLDHTAHWKLLSLFFALRDFGRFGDLIACVVEWNVFVSLS